MSKIKELFIAYNDSCANVAAYFGEKPWAGMRVLDAQEMHWVRVGSSLLFATTPATATTAKVWVMGANTLAVCVEGNTSRVLESRRDGAVGFITMAQGERVASLCVMDPAKELQGALAEEICRAVNSLFGDIYEEVVDALEIVIPQAQLN